MCMYASLSFTGQVSAEVLHVIFFDSHDLSGQQYAANEPKMEPALSKAINQSKSELLARFDALAQP